MSYDKPGRAYCPVSVQACRQGESDTRGPGFCPSKAMTDELDAAVALYGDLEIRKATQESSRVEEEGHRQ